MRLKSNLNEIIISDKAFRVKSKRRVFVDKYSSIPKLNDLLVISDYINKESESLTKVSSESSRKTLKSSRKRKRRSVSLSNLFRKKKSSKMIIYESSDDELYDLELDSS
ncbi:hypothetical protein A2U01_0054756 [Trifolium medium]|uniref:Uncharacterized protein n=1 Tax=Trifolium medium TaxID=97028 RepID=A0A392RBA6_9FABA|nr:hypothetical protein [Trifolium medium]